ncbi:MAG: hypothetical protein ACYCWW_01120 [Deltaproteobacteria bacterium]
MSALLLAALLSGSSPAAAQALAKRSIIEYNAGDFEKALLDAQRAYELEPLAGLLYNLGQCHRALHHWERAEFFYRGYLREKPRAKNRAEVAQLIAQMQAKRAKEEAREAAPPPALVLPVAPAPAPPVRMVPAAVPAAAVVAPAPERHVAGLAWGLMGSGAAAGVAGGIAWGLAQSLRAQGGAGGPPTIAALTQSNTLAVIGNVLVPVGAALLASGAGLALFGGMSSAPSAR